MPGVGIGGEKEQISVLRPDRNRGFKTLKSFTGEVKGIQGLKESTRRNTRPLAKALETPPDPVQRDIGLTKVSGRDEPSPRIALHRITHTRGKPVEVRGFRELALIPKQVCKGHQTFRLRGIPSQGSQCVPTRRTAPSILQAQFLGQFAPEEWIRVFSVGDFLQVFAIFTLARELAQRRKLAPAEVIRVREPGKKPLRTRKLPGRAGIVEGEVSPGEQGKAMLGIELLHFGKQNLGPRAVMRMQGALEPVVNIVVLLVGQFHRSETIRLAGRHQCHSPRAIGSVALEQRLHWELLVNPQTRIAHQQRAAHGVVSDHRLQMGARGFNGGQGERHAPVQEFDGRLPGNAKLAGNVAVFHRPMALHVIGSSVVTNLFRQNRVIHCHPPITAQGA